MFACLLRSGLHLIALYFALNFQMATALRKGPYQTNILFGGYDESVEGGASLYFIDMYSALATVNFGVHGHASNFCLSIFDRLWKVSLV